MTQEAKTTVRAWVVRDGGNAERTAQWMARAKIGTVAACRELILEAILNG